MNNLTEFLRNNYGAMALTIVAVLFANAYLLFSIQRRGSDQKTVETVSGKSLRSTKVVLAVAPFVSAIAAIIVLIWYWSEKHTSTPKVEPTPTATVGPVSSSTPGVTPTP